MSVYFFAFNKEKKECICLGKKDVRDDFEYQGPSLFIGDKNYFLPKKYLELLILRFSEDSSKESVVILPDYELFDTEDYLAEDEECTEIGGDGYPSLPLSTYLPELKDENVLEEIKREGVVVG